VDKLIIHHGDRVTEHEIGDGPLTIGRDPECDLFFADRKLSRKHARIERAGGRVRLVDLESRNGTWVNEVRVEARELAPGDEIRLGGLRIYIERSREGRLEEEPTVYLTPAAPEVPDTGTVMVSKDADRESVPIQTVTLAPDDSSTVVLATSAPPAFSELDADEADETLKRPEPEKTVLLEGEMPGKLFDTGTVVFRGMADPAHQEDAARLDPRQAAAGDSIELLDDKEPPASERSLSASVTYVPPSEPAGGRGWAARFAPLAAALAAFALVVVALPLLRILSAALLEESSSRARALVDLLAAANQATLGEARVQEVSVDRVAAEPGVAAAYILTPTGEVLAPKDLAGKRPEIDGLPGGVADVRSFREARAANGDRVLAQPVVHRGRRVGVAVLVQRAPAHGLPWVALAFGSLLLAIAVAGVVLLAAKMTVSPLHDLRLEVDAVTEGRGSTLAVERSYSELSRLASSLNRLLAARRAISGAAPTPSKQSPERR
jgi:predicted component of type VI protein secretion system